MSEHEPSSQSEPEPLSDKKPEPSGLELAQTLFQLARNKEWVTLGIAGVYLGFRLTELNYEARNNLNSPEHTIYEGTFTQKEVSPLHAEEPLSPQSSLTPAQQTRLKAYEQILKRAQEHQLKIVRGESWQFNILDENYNEVLDERKKPMSIPITQETVDGWYMLAKRIGEGLERNPQTAHMAEQIREKCKAEKQAAFAAEEQAAVSAADTILRQAKDATAKSAAEAKAIDSLWERSNDVF